MYKSALYPEYCISLMRYAETEQKGRVSSLGARFCNLLIFKRSESDKRGVRNSKPQLQADGSFDGGHVLAAQAPDAFAQPELAGGG